MQLFPDWMAAGLLLTERAAPKAVSLVRGMAEGAGVPYEQLFASWYEELLFVEANKEKILDTGCTDIVVKDGDNVLIGHTNDGAPNDKISFVKVKVNGLPDVLVVFSGECPSAAANSAGLVFSGNQIDANDTRPGVPRMFLYMEACWSRSIEEAERILMNKERASSFNNIVADANGRVITLEASATQSAKLKHKDGLVAHTNNFIWLPHKEGREGESLECSKDRLDRAIDEAKKLNGVIGISDMEAILSSHGKGGLCRHSKDISTGFSVVFVPKYGVMLYGNGLPCKTEYKAYQYASEPTGVLSSKALDISSPVATMPAMPTKKRKVRANVPLSFAEAKDAMADAVEKSAEEGIPVALGGGFAMQAYGSDRLTQDVDLIATKLPSFAADGDDLVFGGKSVDVNGIPIDVIVRADDYADLYEEAVQKAKPKPGYAVKIITPEYLVAMKMVAGRPKDDLDLNYLLSSVKMDMPTLKSVVQRFLGRYAVSDLASRIQEAKWMKKAGKL
jgi:hypothetical protein